ncbi:MAG: ParB N-terminal domain-containing protein, partial [Oscillospiraceae bacterium]
MNSAATKEANSGSNDFVEVYLSPYEVKPTESNFYSQENIEELADAFLAVGQQQPTVLALTEGEYRIVSGHRRNAANILNIERGEMPPEAKIRYLYKAMTPAMLELSLIMGNALNRKLTPYEETEQAARLKTALLRAKNEDGLEFKGRLRDIIAGLLETSTTQVARMEKINATLTDEAKEQFKAGNIGITTAYETAKLQPEAQKEVAALAAGEEVKQKDIAERVREKQQQEALDRAAKQVDQAVKKAEH